MLHGAGVGDLGLAAIAHLTSLEELCMDSRLFTDQGLKAVAPLTRLRALDVFGACISDAGCVHLRCGSQTEKRERKKTERGGGERSLSFPAVSGLMRCEGNPF